MPLFFPPPPASHSVPGGEQASAFWGLLVQGQSLGLGWPAPKCQLSLCPQLSSPKGIRAPKEGRIHSLWDTSSLGQGWDKCPP